MREDLSRYTCDNCKNTVTILTGGYFGTPLHHNWVRMYILLKPSDVQKTKLHFCSSKCAVTYLEKK
jgi:transposase-like protein